MRDGFQLGSLLVQPTLNTVSGDGTTEQLEPKVMEVLACLADHPGQTLSKDFLLRTVWPDSFVTDDVLIRCISELRRVLGDQPRHSRIIQTIAKRGYRLMVPVQPIRATPDTEQLSLPQKPGNIFGYADGDAHQQPKRSRQVALVVAAAVLAGLLTSLSRSVLPIWKDFSETAPVRSVAVVPMKSISGNQADEIFAYGLTRQLVSELSRATGIRVISQTSTEVYRNTQQSLPELARQFQADAIVEGSVLRDRNRIHVIAQLVYVHTEKPLWSQSYDRQLGDDLAVQSTLAKAISDEIRVVLAARGQELLPAASFRFKTIDFPGARKTRVHSVNARGDIVGMFTDARGGHGFLLKDGTFVALNYPASTFTSARGINSNGIIAGGYSDARELQHGFVLTNGTFSSLDFPNALSTNIYDINDAGDVTGDYTDSSRIVHGFVLIDGTFRVLDFPGTVRTAPGGVNSSDVVVGSCSSNLGPDEGFIAQQSSFGSIRVPGSSSTDAIKVNDSGSVVGFYTDTSGITHGFLRSAQHFQRIDFPGASLTHAIGINSRGWIVGDYQDHAGESHGFVAIPR